MNYYNEIDPYAARWLGNLMLAGHIPLGIIDTRSIEDVTPSDLAGFTQCHFFAGIGVWSYALRRAGWPDERPVWTGSCPCQPFSAAGKGSGFADERHLWPAFYHLIEQCRPSVIIGEQVASKDANPWIDLVQTDMEALGYGVGAIAFPSAGVGAPHIRDRLYWVAYAADQRQHGRWPSEASYGRITAREQLERLCDAGGVADTELQQRPDRQRGLSVEHDATGRIEGAAETSGLCGNCGLADSSGERRQQDTRGPSCNEKAHGVAGRDEQQPDGDHIVTGDVKVHRDGEAGPTNGYWRDADWLFCRDGKWRPVEPGFQQMADGSSASLGRVRAGAVQEIQEEIDAWAIRYQADAGESLRGVWRDLQSQALCERQAGRFSGVQSPPVLLAFLRQLTEQGWRFSDALACSRSEASEILLRVMRFDGEAACTPLRRELAEQLSGKPSDPLRELSSLLAHHAAQCWGEACRTKAGAASFPLAHNAPARVGRLRAYGNAITAPAAEAWIRCVMECMP